MAVEDYKFNTVGFISSKIQEIRGIIGGDRCIIAISGGVDSTTCAVLMHKALGRKLLCVFIDTGFMREGEPEGIRHSLTEPPLSLPLRVVEAKDRLLESLKGISDAETKRKVFRDEFYRILGEEVKREGVSYLAQGTIAPDWIETSGGIKTQHNVLEQVGIDTSERYGFHLLEPLADLYKDQVRLVAESLQIPAAISQRQPFPGPGMLVRCVGEISEQKLSIAKRANRIFEERVEVSGVTSHQYFAAVLDNTRDAEQPSSESRSYIADLFPEARADFSVLSSRVTGVKGDLRTYGQVGILTMPQEEREAITGKIHRLVEVEGKLVSRYPSLTRVLFTIEENGKDSAYVVALRAINTRDFMTAEVTPLPWDSLQYSAESILETCGNVMAVCYDITPKPPGTVEFE